jgi:hypothetical protein
MRLDVLWPWTKCGVNSEPRNSRLSRGVAAVTLSRVSAGGSTHGRVLWPTAAGYQDQTYEQICRLGDEAVPILMCFDQTCRERTLWRHS